MIAGKPYAALTQNTPTKIADAEEWLGGVLEGFGVALRPQVLTAEAQGQVTEESVDDANELLRQVLAYLSRGAGARLVGLLEEPDRYNRLQSDSERDFHVVSILLDGGLSDDEIATVWRNSQLGQREKVQGREDYVSLTIARARANGPNSDNHNLTSNRKGGPLEVRLLEEVNAAKLQGSGQAMALPFLLLLGRDGFIVERWSHLVAGYPKTGKTELLTTLCHAWGTQGKKVLYFTEEPRSIWAARLAQQPGGWDHVTLAFALGMPPSDLIARIKAGDETVVIIDTVRNLLGLIDENDNSRIAHALNPYVEAARQGGQTIIFSHHDRKGGGGHGEGIAGGHAFLDIVDIALELRRDAQSSRRRLIRGWGRIIQVPKLVYEMNADDKLVAVGDPGPIAFEAVKERALDVVPAEWATTKEVLGLLDEPRPSAELLRQALDAPSSRRTHREAASRSRRRQAWCYLPMAEPRLNFQRPGP